ncbi:hypothetical protein RYX36_012098 [Vicia faba]
MQKKNQNVQRLDTDADVKDGVEEENIDETEYYAWNEFRLHPLLMKAIHKLGFKEPTSIQKACIPAATHQGKDVIGAAETGSGKTLPFGLPILQRLLEEREKASNGCEELEERTDYSDLTPSSCISNAHNTQCDYQDSPEGSRTGSCHPMDGTQMNKGRNKSVHFECETDISSCESMAYGGWHMKKTDSPKLHSPFNLSPNHLHRNLNSQHPHRNPLHPIHQPSSLLSNFSDITEHHPPVLFRTCSTYNSQSLTHQQIPLSSARTTYSLENVTPASTLCILHLHPTSPFPVAAPPSKKLNKQKQDGSCSDGETLNDESIKSKVKKKEKVEKQGCKRKTRMSSVWILMLM